MIEIKVKELTGPWEKTKGLIYTKKTHPVYLRTRFGIHTFGMKQSIDVLILDGAGCVVKARASLKPRSIFFWKPCYDKVIELPNGEISRLKLKVGERVKPRIVK